jgi:hypothetical protein
MTIDCQWISKNLEAWFAGGLTAEEDQFARGHIEGCSTCREEVQALREIDPLIKNYFQRELARALSRSSGVVVRRRKVLPLGLAAATLAGIVLVLVLRGPAVNTVSPPAQTQIVPAAPVETIPLTIKANTAAEAERAKPSSESTGGSLNRRPGEDGPATTPGSVPGGDAPDFLVTDAAGYSRSLDDYRDHILLIGVWSSDERASTANLERLYKSFGSNSKLRIVGVSNARQTKPANTTFPVAYNQGSKLFGAASGEFVLLDETGAVRLRGSLVKDFDSLRKYLRAQ